MATNIGDVLHELIKRAVREGVREAMVEMGIADNATGKQLLTVTEAGKRIGRSGETIRRMIRAGTIPFVPSEGGRPLVDRKDLEHWIENRKDQHR